MSRTDTFENTMVPRDGEVFIETEFPGYFISNQGRMYSYLNRYGTKVKTYQALDFHANERGYMVVTISDKIAHKVRHILVHRLVYATFNSLKWSDFKGYLTIDHIDGDKTNNRLDNLRLVTPSENVSLAWNEQKLRDKSLKAVNKYTLDGKYVKTYKSARFAAQNTITDYQDLETSMVSIKSVCNKWGNRQSALGYQWRFVEDVPAGVDIDACVDCPSMKRAKKVAQKTLDGELVRIWPSTYRAEKALGVNSRCISAVARGEYKTAYGYTWEYVEKE